MAKLVAAVPGLMKSTFSFYYSTIFYVLQAISKVELWTLLQNTFSSVCTHSNKQSNKPSKFYSAGSHLFFTNVWISYSLINS